ncbi:MAG TPA: PIN domain-containing protein [Trueperaceae bacterium]|nr:PIN domain-containing protein [Trueperaceae bacterium]
MDRLFIDANVLFSAAYRENAGVVRLWSREAVIVLTSAYALDEARRNLITPQQANRLEELVQKTQLVSTGTVQPVDRQGIELPEKDWPIVAGALAGACTHLITGDRRHFGPHFGKRLMGLLVVTPATYLAENRGRS